MRRSLWCPALSLVDAGAEPKKDVVAFERAAVRRHDVIVRCSLFGVEHDERNDPLVQIMI